MVEVNALDMGNEISLFPTVLANTVEIERSVIRLEIMPTNQEVIVTSEVPFQRKQGQ